MNTINAIVHAIFMSITRPMLHLRQMVSMFGRSGRLQSPAVLTSNESWGKPEFFTCLPKTVLHIC